MKLKRGGIQQPLPLPIAQMRKAEVLLKVEAMEVALTIQEAMELELAVVQEVYLEAPVS